MKIDHNKTVAECQKAFDERCKMNDMLALPGAEAAIFSISMALEVVNSKQFVCCAQMATYALPTLIQWHCNRAQKTNWSKTSVDSRTIFLAYLKDAVLFRVNESVQKGITVPAHLKDKVIDFLINLSDAMTRNKVKTVKYPEEKADEWIERFFGDPWKGTNDNALKFMKMIREHACDFIECADGAWQFVDAEFIEKLDSINTVELTYIDSGLRASGMDCRSARLESIKQFSNTLLTHPEGSCHYWATEESLSMFWSDEESSRSTASTLNRNHNK